MAIKSIQNLTIDDIRPITVSFKKTEDELILYKWILMHSGYSGFIKDKLRESKEEDTPEKENKLYEPVKNELIDMDF